MLLFYSNTSPYSRKVRMVINEKRLNERIELKLCNPFEEAPALRQANPLRRVPTLVTDDGYPLYDSPVICEYLDSLIRENRLIPESGMGRWEILRWEALADGILDAAYNVVMEHRRPKSEQSTDWVQRWEEEIIRAIQQAECDLDSMPKHITLAQIGLGSALGYLDFRLPEISWQESHPGVAGWYEEFRTRPSMVNTLPE